MDRSKLLTLITKAAKLLDQWTQLQDGSLLLIGNFGNLLQRLPELTTAQNYLGLADDEQSMAELQRRVLAKQLSSLDRVLDRLKALLDELAETVRSQEKVCQEAWAVLGNAPPAAVCATAVGAVASPAQLVEAMEDAWSMCRDEVCLKTAIAYQLHPGMTGMEFQDLNRLFGSCVNINSRSASFLMLQNNAFAV